MTVHYCQMFCSEPLDADAHPPVEGWKNTCAPCEKKLKWICGTFLPSIRKNGYWVPPGASPDDELAALVDQADVLPQMREALAIFDHLPSSDGRTLADLLAPTERREGPA